MSHDLMIGRSALDQIFHLLSGVRTVLKSRLQLVQCYSHNLHHGSVVRYGELVDRSPLVAPIYDPGIVTVEVPCEEFDPEPQ